MSDAPRHDRAIISGRTLRADRVGRASRPQRQSRTSVAALSGYLLSWFRTGVWPDSVQVSGETLSNSGCPPVVGVALIWLAASPGAARGEAGKGSVLLEVAVPSLLKP